jgi:hypothetical protein
MGLLLLILVLFLLFGGGGWAYGGPDRGHLYGGGGIGIVLIIFLVAYLLGAL